MKKYIPIVIILILGAVSFIASTGRSNAEALSPEVQRMIEQDHIMVGLLVNYVAEMQERGVLPKQEDKK